MAARARTEILWPVVKLTDTGEESVRETADYVSGFSKIVIELGDGDAVELQKRITIIRTRRNPMPKSFTSIVPPSLKAASETYQFSPAVRIVDQILISGIVGIDAEGRLHPDFRSQAENARPHIHLEENFGDFRLKSSGRCHGFMVTRS